jgi:hypothetical protein
MANHVSVSVGEDEIVEHSQISADICAPANTDMEEAFINKTLLPWSQRIMEFELPYFLPWDKYA